MRITESKLRSIIRNVIRESQEYSEGGDEVIDPFNENNPELSRLMKIDRDIAIVVLDKNIEISEKIFRVDEAILDVRQIISVAKLNSNQRAQTYGNELNLKFKTYLRHLSNDFN
jgi:hypothetical protein